MSRSALTRRALAGTAAASALTLALAPAALADESDAADEVRGPGGDKPYLGARLFPTVDGAVLVHVIDGSPADAAGLEVGDIVVSIDGVELDHRGALREALGSVATGDSLDVTYVSDGASESTTVVVGDPDDRPEPPAREDVPWTGVRLERRAADAEGAVIRMVIAGSPADEAGLQAGDVITEIGGTPVDTWWEAQNALKGSEPGDTVSVEYARDGALGSVVVELGSADESPVPPGPGPRAEERREGVRGALRDDVREGVQDHVREHVRDVAQSVVPWLGDDD